MQDLEKRIERIEERNRKVEKDKAWETSTTRKITLIIITYIITTIIFFFIGNPSPFVNAIIPSLGFFLSTLTLNFKKMYWLEHISNC